VCAVSWSPDGRRFASCDDYRNTCIWSASDWTKTLDLADCGDVSGGMRWSADGSRVVVPNWGGKKVVVYDASTGAQVVTLSGHGMTGPLDADWSPDGSLVVTASDDGTVRVWNASTGALMRSMPVGTSQMGVCWISGDIVEWVWAREVRRRLFVL
jgi:WD40 repeat protein